MVYPSIETPQLWQGCSLKSRLGATGPGVLQHVGRWSPHAAAAAFARGSLVQEPTTPGDKKCVGRRRRATASHGHPYPGRNRTVTGHRSRWLVDSLVVIIVSHYNEH